MFQEVDDVHYGKMVFMRNGKKHRRGWPAQVTNNQIRFYEKGRLHRMDGPAVIYTNGDKIWYLKGVFQRMEWGNQEPGCPRMTAWDLYQELFPDDVDMADMADEESDEEPDEEPDMEESDEE
jgi:hypothetical protein